MKISFGSKVLNATKSFFTTEDIFWQNEIEANKKVSQAMFNSGIILAVCWLITYLGIFNHVKLEDMTRVAIQAECEFALAVFLTHITKGEKKWLKVVLIVLMVASYARIDSVLSIYVPLIMAMPVVVSCRYYSQKLTAFVALYTSVIFAVTALFGSRLGVGMMDLNVAIPIKDLFIKAGGSIRNEVLAAGIDYGRYALDIMVHSFLPRLMIFLLICLVCLEISYCGRKMILDADAAANKSARINTELGLASKIQIGLLPHTFPAFPDRKEFDLHASMDAAKEVGGDFYDMFFIDDDHLAIVMADVSGKGVPAALFMMASKTIINNCAGMGYGKPSAILSYVNNKLCENNAAEMFVTVWLGILEVSTGTLTVANGGHEYPVIYTPGGEYVLQKEKHNFVLGGMADMPYKDFVYQLEPGAGLFIYTDGVPEATNAEQELYGTERMVAALNKKPDAEPCEILKIVRDDIDAFVGDAEQFDDITMLCLKYKGNGK